MTLRKITS